MIPRPIFDQLVVTPTVVKQSAGGIWLPDGNDRAEGGGCRGTVVATGPGRMMECGIVGPMPVDVGDEIVYSKYAGQELKIGGSEYVVIRIDDVRVVLACADPDELAPGGC